MIRYRRPRIESSDPRIRIRTRYLEAIRAGANIHDATEYANASDVERPRYIPIKVEIPLAPKGYGKPGEIEMLLPKSMAKIEISTTLPSTDPELESVKRPMAAVEKPRPLPPVEIPDAPVAPAAPVELPSGWDDKEFNWQALRTLCIQVVGKTPHSRTDAVNSIRKKLEG